MDIADQADKSAQTQQGSKMNRVMSAGTDLQPGRVAETNTCLDPKWARISPATITDKGQQRAQRASGQGVVTSSGVVDRSAT